MWEYSKPPRSEELYHFGILGMKWGKRRTDAQLGQKEGSSKKSANISKSGVDLDELGKRLDTLRGSPAGETMARKRLKPPREEPMHKWTDKERDKFDSDYEKGKTEISKIFKNAKTSDEKLNAMVEDYNLEEFYQSYSDWD